MRDKLGNKPRPHTMARGSMFRLLCRCYSGCYYRHPIGLSPTTASLLWRDKHEDIKRSFISFPPDCTLSLSHCGASNTLFRNLTVNRMVYTTFRSFSFFSSSDTVFALSSGHGKCGECDCWKDNFSNDCISIFIY